MSDKNNYLVTMVIPVGPQDGYELSELLLPAHIPNELEIICVADKAAPNGLDDRIRWLLVEDGQGRAAFLNAGAQAAKGKYYWFVHADSKLSKEAFQLLCSSLRRSPRALHYFQLSFYDGGDLMRINEIGVKLRCWLFRAPFGDQAICLAADLHDQIGGFSTEAAFGEDHLYVRTAIRNGIQLNQVEGEVATSARRYQQQGWWNVVIDFQKKWIGQAIKDR